MSASRLVCAGCGWQADTRAAHPFRCAHAGRDDVDHVLRHELGTGDPVDADHDGNPFVRWRRSLWAWHAARARGLDDAIAGVDGQGFRGTPYARSEALSRRLGLDLWIKDETGNVTGSHKARHLMGILLHLQLVEGSTASSGLFLEQTASSTPVRASDCR